MRNKKETIQFKQTVAAGANLSGATALSFNIRSAGTLQRIFGKFNQGQQDQLQVRPYLTLRGDRSEELVTYPSGSNRYMSGDNVPFDLYIDFDVQPNDQIKLDVKNESAFDYTLDISFEIDYVGGTSRVV